MSGPKVGSVFQGRPELCRSHFDSLFQGFVTSLYPFDWDSLRLRIQGLDGPLRDGVSVSEVPGVFTSLLSSSRETESNLRCRKGSEPPRTFGKER